MGIAIVPILIPARIGWYFERDHKNAIIPTMPSCSTARYCPSCELSGDCPFGPDQLKLQHTKFTPGDRMDTPINDHLTPKKARGHGPRRHGMLGLGAADAGVVVDPKCSDGASVGPAWPTFSAERLSTEITCSARRSARAGSFSVAPGPLTRAARSQSISRRCRPY